MREDLLDAIEKWTDDHEREEETDLNLEDLGPKPMVTVILHGAAMIRSAIMEVGAVVGREIRDLRSALESKEVG